jgi:predicted DNA-binding transcriptional regulator YafY
MKAERLLAMLTILLNRKKISASSLARELEVSVRTIYRDAEALAEAGIPVFATSGRDGGFELVEGFKVDSQLLETGEIGRILAGLEGLAAVVPGQELSSTIEKFRLIGKKTEGTGVRVPENHIFIELTPSRREKKLIEAIEESINKRTAIRIRYADGAGNETLRVVEPEALVFIWSSWYAWGWCALRGDFRLFKVSRVLGAETAALARTGPKADLAARPWAREWETKPSERILFAAGRVALPRLGEFFDSSEISETNDGRVLVDSFFPLDEWVLSFVMSLPGAIEILKPESFREAVADRARNLARANLKAGEVAEYGVLEGH